MRALRDEDYIRGNVPFTKRDIRVHLIDALDIEKGMTALDIGAGTGGVTVEMARRGAYVTSIEVNPDGIELIRANAKKHGVELEIIIGFAPEAMPQRKFDRIFIGGSKGKLKEIIEESIDRLNRGGVIVSSFILIKNVYVAEELFKKYLHDVEITMVSTANVDGLGMLKGNNPIFILRGVK